MTDMPHLIAGDKIPEELYRITEAYLREHDMPVIGTRLNAALCNKAIDWWNALQPKEPTSSKENDHG